MSVREVDGVRIEENTGRITAIEPKQRNAKVSLDVEGLKFAVAGWAEKDIVEHLKVGDVVEMTVERELPDGFRRITHIAPVTTEKGSGGEEAQMAKQDAPSSTGHGDAQGGGDGGPIPAAERAVPNEDTARFEGWGFAGQCGIVALAYGELSDAVEGGELDKITPSLLKGVTDAILNAADQAQRALVGRTDRSALSHRAAREMVRTAVDKRPLRAGLADIDAWATDIQRTATRLLVLAASL